MAIEEVQNTGQQPTIRFSESRIHNGADHTRLYQASKNMGQAVTLESLEEYAVLHREFQPDATDEQIGEAYKGEQYAYDIYKNRGWNLYDYDGIYDKGFDSPREQGQLKWYGKDDSWAYAAPSNIIEFAGGATALTQHDDQVADSNNFYKTKNGLIAPIDDYYATKETNRLVNEFDQDLNTFVFRELKDGEMATGQVKNQEWLGGARGLSSSWAGSAMRGIVSGAIGKTAQGGAGLANIANAAWSLGVSIILDKSYDEVSQSTDLGKWANEFSNTASSLQRQNHDEAQGAFNNANSFLYGFWDGVGQFAPMAVGGGATSLLGASGKLALHLAIAPGSLAVYNQSRTDMISQGYSVAEADATSIAKGIMTQMTEAIGGNAIERLGIAAGYTIFGREGVSAVVKAHKDLTGKVTKAAVSSNPSKKYSLSKFMGNLKEGYQKYAIPTEGTTLSKIRSAAIAGGEEGAEEVIENIGHNAISSLFNGVQREMAVNNKKKNGDSTFTPDPANPGYYIQKNSNGFVVGRLSPGEKLALEQEMEFSKRILSGENQLDTEMNWDEPLLAAMSSMFTMGIAGGMHTQKTKKDAGAHSMGKRVAKDPTAIEEIRKDYRAAIKQGKIDPVKGAEAEEMFIQDIMYYAQLIKDHNLDDPKLIEILGDESFSFEYATAQMNLVESETLQKNREALKDPELDDKAIDQITAHNAEITKRIGVPADINDKGLATFIKDQQSLMTTLTTPKVSDAYIDGVEPKTSQRFTEKLNDFYAAKILLSDKAYKLAKERNGGEKPEPEQVYQALKEVRDKANSTLKETLVNNKLFTTFNLLNTNVTQAGQAGKLAAVEHHNGLLERPDRTTEITSMVDRMTKLEEEKFDFDEITDEDDKPKKQKAMMVKPLKDLRAELKEMKAQKKRGSKDPGLDRQIAEWEEEIKIQKKAGTKDTAGREVTDKGEGEVKPKILYKERRGLDIHQAIAEVIKRGDLALENIQAKTPLNKALVNLSNMAQELANNVGEINFNPGVRELMKGAIPSLQKANTTLNLFNEYANGPGGETIHDTGAANKLQIDNAIKDIEDAEQTSRGYQEQIKDPTPEDATQEMMAAYIMAQREQWPVDIAALFSNEALGILAKETSMEFISTVVGILNQPVVKGPKDSSLSVAQVLATVNTELLAEDSTVSDPVQLTKQIDAIDAYSETIQYVADLMYHVVENGIEQQKDAGSKEHSIFNLKLNKNSRPGAVGHAWMSQIAESLNSATTTWRTNKKLAIDHADKYVTKEKLGDQSMKTLWLRSALDMSADSKSGLKLSETERGTIQAKLRAVGLTIKQAVYGDESIPELESNDEAYDNTYSEDLYAKYYESKPSGEQGQKDRQDVIDAYTKVDILLMDVEEMLSGKLDGILEYIGDRTKGKMGHISRLENYSENPVIVDPTTVEYSGYMNVKTFSQSAALLEQALQQNAENDKFSLNTFLSSIKDQPEAKKKFHDTRYNLFQYLDVTNKLGRGKGEDRVSTRREIYNILDQVTKYTQKNKIPFFVETFQQLEAITAVVGFVQDKEEDKWYNKKAPEAIINSLFLRGYPGTGKSEIGSTNSLLAIAALKNEPVNVLYVVQTDELEAEHVERIKLVNKILDGMGSNGLVNPKFIYAHELHSSEQAWTDNDFVYYEEASTIPDPDFGLDETSEGKVLRKFQDKNPKKVVYIGDEGQIQNLTTFGGESVNNFGASTTPFSLVLRDQMGQLTNLSNELKREGRKAKLLNAEQTFTYPTTRTEFKKEKKRGYVGIQYIAEEGGVKTIVDNYVAAVDRHSGDKGINQMFIVPTYANKQEILATHGDKLKGHKVYTLEYDAAKIRANLKNNNSNVSGLNRQQIFLPFTISSMQNGGLGFTPLADPKKYSNANAANSFAFLDTGITRTKQYVEMIGNPALSKDVGPKGQILGAEKQELTTEQKATALEEQREARKEYFKAVLAESTIVKPVAPGKKKKKGGPKGSQTDSIYYEDNSEMYIEDGSEEKALAAYSKIPADQKEYADTPKVSTEITGSINESRKDKYTEAEQKRYDSAYDYRNMLTATIKYRMANGINELDSAEAALNTAITIYANKYEPLSQAQMSLPFQKREAAISQKRQKVRNDFFKTYELLNRNIGIDKWTSFTPTLKAEGINMVSSPTFVKMIGYTEDGTPIVNLYEVGFTVRKGHLKGSNDAALMASRFIAEEKGWVVNELQNVELFASKKDVTSSSSLVSPTTEQTKWVANELGLEREQFNIPSIAALYDNTRRVMSVESTSGETFFRLDPVSDATTGKNYSIDDILQDNTGITIMLRDQVTNKITPHKDDVLDSQVKSTTSRNPILRRISSAIEYDQDSTIYATHMALPAGVSSDVIKASGDDMFNRKVNTWFDRKVRILEAVKTMPATSPLVRKWNKSITVSAINADGTTSPDTYKDAWVTMIETDEQFAHIKEVAGLGKATIQREGLDIVAIDTPAEYGNPDKSQGYANVRLSSHPQYDKWMDMPLEDAVNEVIKALDAGYADRDRRDAKLLKQMNLDKFKQAHKARNNKSEREFLSSPAISSGETAGLMPSKDKPFDWEQLTNKVVEKDGYKLVTPIDSDGYTIPLKWDITSSGNFEIKIAFKDRDGKVVHIPFSNAPYDNMNDVEKYINSILKDLNSKPINELLNKLDVEGRKDQNKKGDKKTYTDEFVALNNQISELILRQSEFKNFLQANSKVLMPIINQSPILSQYYNIASIDVQHKRRDQIVLRGKDWRAKRDNLISSAEHLISSMKGQLTKDGVHFTTKKVEGSTAQGTARIYKPVFTNSTTKDTIGVNVTSLITNIVGINQAVVRTSKHFKKVDGTPVKESVPQPEKEVKPPVTSEGVANKRRRKRNIDPDLSELKPKLWTPANTRYIRRSSAARQIARIIGSKNAELYLGFNDGLLEENGTKYWGYVKDGLIAISATQDGVEANTARHESLHFVIEYLMSFKQRQKLFDAAQKRAGREMDYGQTHEYLAELFEDKSYTGNSWLDKVLNFIRQWFKNKFGGNRNTIADILTSVDQGDYSNVSRKISKGNESSFFPKEIKEDVVQADEPSNVNNRFMSQKVYDALVDTFGSEGYINWWAEKNIVPSVINHSNIGKTVSDISDIGNNPFFKATNLAYENITKYNIWYQRQNEIDMGFVINDEDDYVDYGSITREHYIAVRKEVIRQQKIDQSKMTNDEKSFLQDDIDHNNKFIKAYIVQELSKDNITDDVSGADLYSNLIQSHLPEVVVDYKLRNGRVVWSRQKNRYDEKDEFNPASKVSAFLNAIYNSTRLKRITYDAQGNIENDDYHDSDSYMDSIRMNKILWNAADQLKGERKKININTLQEVLTKRSKEIKGADIEKAHIDTFLLEFGNVKGTRLTQSDSILKKNFDSTLTIEGYGYQRMAEDLDSILAEEEISSKYSKQLEAKRDSFKLVIAMINTAYSGTQNTMRANLKNSRFSQIINNSARLKEMSINDMIEKKHYSGPNGYVSEQTIEDLIGEAKKYRVLNGELHFYDVDRVNPQWKKMINKDGSFAGKDSISDAASLYKYLIGDSEINASVVDALFDDPRVKETRVGTSFVNAFESLGYAAWQSAVANDDSLVPYGYIAPEVPISAEAVKETRTGESIASPYKLLNPASIAYHTVNKKTLTNEAMFYNPDGNFKMFREKETRLISTSEGASEVSGGSASLMAAIELEAQTIEENNEEIESAIATIKKGEKTIWRDPVMNNKMDWSLIGTIEYASNINGHVMAKDMSAHSMLTVLGDTVISELQKRRGTESIPAYIEDIGDSSKIHYTNTNYKGEGRMFDGAVNPETGVITSVKLNPKKFIPIIDDFVQHDHAAQKVTAKLWTDTTGKKTYESVKPDEKDIIKAIERDLIEHKEYIENKDGSYSIGNLGMQARKDGKDLDSPYIRVPIDKWNELVEKGDDASLASLVAGIENLFQPRIARLTEMLIEGYNGMGNAGAIGIESAEPLAKILFWNHHMLNKSMNQVSRGGVEHYADINDYVKRGKGFDAVGEPFSEDYIPNFIPTLTYEDLKMSNALFSNSKEKQTRQDGTKDYAMTDGLVPVNPSLHRQMAKSRADDYGDITTSPQKTIFFDFKAVKGKVKMQKMSMWAPQWDTLSDPYYISMMRVFYGELWDIKLETTPYKQRQAKFEEFVEKIAKQIETDLANPDNKGNSPTMEKMVGWITFKSAGKLGNQGLQRFENPDKPRFNQTYDDAYVDTVDREGLRLQQVTGNFSSDEEKLLATQMLYVLGVGDNNNERVNTINNSLADIANIGTKVLGKAAGHTKDSIEYLLRITGEQNKGNKGSIKDNELLNNTEDIAPEIIKRQSLAALSKDATQYVRPKFPGSALIQLPSDMDYAISDEGHLYPVDNIPEGVSIVESRKLKPMRFFVDGKVIETREGLDRAVASGKKITMTPQEVIMPFVHQDKFGIQSDTSANDIFSITIDGQKTNFKTGLEQIEHMSKDEMVDMMAIRYSTMGFWEVMSTLHPDVSAYIRKNNKELFEGKGKGALVQPSPEDVLELYSEIASYFWSLNNALDVYSARVPFTNASSGFPSRIVEFSNTYDNTIRTSAEKNILDGSDYDIDELHVFYAPDLKGLNQEDLDMWLASTDIFNSIMNYYKDTGNIALILQQVTTDNIKKLAGVADKKKNNPMYSNDLYSALNLRSEAIMGKNMIENFAASSNDLSRLFHIPPELRKDLFEENTIPNMKGDGKASFDDVIKFVGQMSEFVNGGADNISLGGALGKINFNQYTSPLIIGMTFHGHDVEAIAGYTNDEFINTLLKGLNTKQRSRYKASGSLLKGLRNFKRQLNNPKSGMSMPIGMTMDDINDYIAFTQTGDKLQELHSIISMQKGFSGSEWDIYSRLNRIETALGSSLSDFVEGNNPTAVEQMNYIRQEKYTVNQMSGKPNKKTGKRSGGIETDEKQMRNPKFAFDLHGVIRTSPQLMEYLNLFNEKVGVYDNGYKTSFYNQFFTDVIQETGVKTLLSRRTFMNISRALDDIMISKYLKDKQPEILMGRKKPYFLADPASKNEFIKDFAPYVQKLKEKDTTSNPFIKDLSINTANQQMQLVGLSGLMGSSRTSMQALKENGFDDLSPKNKKLFSIYNALVYGFGNSNGQMNSVIDTAFENDISGWLKLQGDIFEGYDPKEVIARRSDSINYLSDKYTIRYRGNVPVIIEEKNGEFLPLQVPFTGIVNTYPASGSPSYSNNISYIGLSDKQIAILKEGKGTTPTIIVTPEQESTDIKPKMTMQMSFSDGTGGRKMRPEFAGKSTMDLIKSGNRTATSRKKGTIDNIKEGDIIKFVGGTGESVLVRVTRKPYNIAGRSAEEWSQLEGWDPSMHAGLVAKGYEQFTYEVVEAPSGVQPKATKTTLVKQPGKGYETFKVFGHGILKDSRDKSTKDDAEKVHNYDIVMLQDGTKAKLRVVDDNTIDVALVKSSETRSHKPDPTPKSRMSNAQATQIVNMMRMKLSSMYPNVRMLTVDNTTSQHPGDAAYIDEKDGIVYVNTEEITPETSIEELGHLYAMVLKKGSPSEYRALQDAADSLIEANDPVALWVMNKYAGRSRDVIRDEVMTRVMQLKNKEQTQDLYESYDAANGRETGGSLWDKWGQAIKNAWKSIWNTLRQAFNLNSSVDVAHRTLGEFARKALNAIEKGETISMMSSADFSKLLFSTLSHKPNNISSVQDLFAFITMGGDNRAGQAEAADLKRRTVEAMGIIRTASGKVSSWYTGEEWNFNVDDIKSTNPKVKKFVKELGDKKIKRSKDLYGSLVGINDYVTAPSKDHKDQWIAKMFGEHTNITTAIFDKFLDEIAHDDTITYMGLEEFQKKNGYKNIIPKGYENTNILVAVNYSDEKESLIKLIDTDQNIVDRNETKTPIVNEVGDVTVHDAHGVYLTKKSPHLTGVKLAILANHMQKTNPKIKVLEAGYARLKEGKNSFFTSDLMAFNNQLIRMGHLPGFLDYLDDNAKKWFKAENTVTPLFNYATYLKALWDTNKREGKGLTSQGISNFSSLSDGERVALYKGRLDELVKLFASSGGNLSPMEMKELKYLRGAIYQHNFHDLNSRTINPYGNLNVDEKLFYDPQSIGNEEVAFISKIRLQAQNKVIAQSWEFHERLGKVLQELKEVKNLSKYSFFNRSKKVYKEFFDVATDMNGNEYRTGAIYWTNNPNEQGLTKSEKELAQRALDRNVPTEILAIGKKLVALMEELMIDNIKHQGIKYGQVYDYSKAKSELLDKTQYYRGWMPMINSATAEKLAQGKPFKSFTDAINKDADRNALFDNDPNITKQHNNEQVFKEMRDHLFTQVGYYAKEGVNPYGITSRSDQLLGIQFEEGTDFEDHPKLIGDGGEKGAKMNKNMSYDIEAIFDYFNLSSKRNAIYEAEVLPVINSTIIYLNWRKDVRGEEIGGLIEWTENFRDMQILSEQLQSGVKFLGISLDKALLTIDKIARPIVLFANPAIAAISLASNTLFTLIEATANQIGNTPYFGVTEIADALKLLVSEDKGKLQQMSMHYQITDMDEMSLINSMKNKKIDKTLFSDWTSAYLNRAVDLNARIVTMAAQMLKEGSYHAHSIDKKTGQVVYDVKKDKRFFSSNGSQTEDQKLMYNAMKKRLALEGDDVESNNWRRGYDSETSQTFKALSDMYVVGPMSRDVSPAISNYAVGKSFLTLSKWFTTRKTNALGKENTFKTGGGVLAIGEKDGEKVAQIERLNGEGYITAAYKFIGHSISHYGKDDRVKFSELEGYKKKNITKFALYTGTWATLSALFAALSFVKYGDDDKPITDLTFFRSAKLAVDSLLVMPVLWSMVTDPFAGMSILSRGFVDAFGGYDWKNIRNLIPGKKLYTITDEITELSTGQDIASRFE